MGEIGEILKSAREKKGISLREAEEDTKIRYKYLEALEEENFDVIPGTVYTKGFIRNYANYLGLDGDQLLAAFKELYREQDEDAPREELVHSPSTDIMRPRFWVYVMIFVALVAILLFVVLNRSVKHDNSNIEQAKPKVGTVKKPSKSVQPVKKTPSVNPQQTPAQIQGVRVDMSVTGKASWVRVEVDGAFNFSGTLTTGMTKSFQGKKSVKVRFGNAPDVSIKVNGVDKGIIGGGKRVLTEEFTAPQ